MLKSVSVKRPISQPPFDLRQLKMIHSFLTQEASSHDITCPCDLLRSFQNSSFFSQSVEMHTFYVKRPRRH